MKPLGDGGQLRAAKMSGINVRGVCSVINENAKLITAFEQEQRAKADDYSAGAMQTFRRKSDLVRADIANGEVIRAGYQQPDGGMFQYRAFGVVNNFYIKGFLGVVFRALVA